MVKRRSTRLNTKASLLNEIATDLLSDRPDLAAMVKDKGWTILHCAVFEGSEEFVTRILSLAPELIHENTTAGSSALAIAFVERKQNVVMRLLEMCPSLVDATMDEEGSTVLYGAARQGFDTVVAHLLAVRPQLINVIAADLRPLHCAASNGHLTVVKQLLAASPELISAATDDGWTALHFAAFRGRSEVVEHLLSVNSASIDAVASRGWTTLHMAASGSHCTVVRQLLAVNPALIHAVTANGSTALHCAAEYSRVALRHAALRADDSAELFKPVAQTLLAIKPELISMKDKKGNTVLHFMAGNCKSKELIEEMWRLHPEALHAANGNRSTPFHVAVEEANEAAIDVFQWTLTLEEIVGAYAHAKQAVSSYEKRFRPVMETQCESLSLWLLPDVIGTVFEYLGFERATRAQRAKRAKRAKPAKRAKRAKTKA